MSLSSADVAVIGGGIIGLATAMEMARKYRSVKVVVLEKEPQIAAHQTGHNSGVIHAGIYYRPGSVKARTCVAGRKALLSFCEQNQIPYELRGKLVVATTRDEVPRLGELMRRGVANGVEGLELISRERLNEMEPHVQGFGALFSPATGITDFVKVAHAYARVFQEHEGEVLTGHEVIRLERFSGRWVIETSQGEVQSKHLINCGGLHATRLVRMAVRNPAVRARPEYQIIPFRGEYYRLVPEREILFQKLIYRVPNPALPFLGAHLTRTLRGHVEVGPNAVLAFAQEGYRKSDVSLSDLWEMLCYRGFWLMARHHWRTELAELYRSLSKRAFVKELRQLVPEITSEDLVPSRTGVRAQLVSATGQLVDDFVISQSEGAVHVWNAPSPAATASLAIAETIVDTAAKAFSLPN